MNSLNDKVMHCAELMREMLRKYEPQNIAVAWTGGKDSTLVLAIWREILQVEKGINPKALNIDTGCKFPEIIKFRDKITAQWNVDLTVITPDIDKDYPIAKDVVTCCSDLKIKPLKLAIEKNSIKVLFTGIRADESSNRASRLEIEQRENPNHLVVNPILLFTESDIWAFNSAHDIPYCSLYDEGYRSLGCVPCTSKSSGSERQGRCADKEKNMNLLTSLGYF